MKIINDQREAILDFMQWNDKNGCYTDEECKLQKSKPFGKREALVLFFSTVNSDFLIGQEVDNPLNFTCSEVLKIAKEKNIYFSTITKLKMLLENNNENCYKKLIDMIKPL